MPDQGVKTTMTANTKALKDARTKIVAAQQDLHAARADAETIMKSVQGKPLTPPNAGNASSTGP